MRKKTAVKSMRINPFRFVDLIYPIAEEEFFENYWEQKPLILTNRQAMGYAGLLTLEDVEALISSTPNVESNNRKEHPLIRFVNNGQILHSGAYFTNVYDGRRARIHPEKVLHGYREGNTIVLNALHQRDPRLAKMCIALEEMMGHLVGVNLYLTPPSAQGFAAHFDSHDVFILQLEGEKLWKIYDSYTPFPIDVPGAGDTFVRSDRPPVCEIVVKPGDLLYIPRGYVHEASTAKSHSLHLTVGIHVITWADLIRELARNTQELRRALPRQMLTRAVSSDTLDEAVSKQLVKACKDSRVYEKALESVKQEYLQRKTRPLSLGLTKSYHLEEINEQSVLQKNTNLPFKVKERGEEVEILFGQGGIIAPSKVVPALQHILREPTFSASTLPNSMTLEGNLVLMKSLFKAGVLEFLT